MKQTNCIPDLLGLTKVTTSTKSGLIAFNYEMLLAYFNEQCTLACSV